MFQTKVVQKIKIHILCSVTSFFLNRAFYKGMWKNPVELGRPQMTVWLMRHCILDTLGYKYTHSGCVTLIGFLLQQFQARLNVT